MGVGLPWLQHMAASGPEYPVMIRRPPPATLRTDYQLTLSADNPPIISRGCVLELVGAIGGSAAGLASRMAII